MSNFEKKTVEEIQKGLEQKAEKVNQKKEKVDVKKGKMSTKEKMWLAGTAIVSAGIGAGTTYAVMKNSNDSFENQDLD